MVLLLGCLVLELGRVGRGVYRKQHHSEALPDPSRPCEKDCGSGPQDGPKMDQDGIKMGQEGL